MECMSIGSPAFTTLENSLVEGFKVLVGSKELNAIGTSLPMLIYVYYLITETSL